MSDLVKIHTPFELVKVDGVDVHVKRDDLCCALPNVGPHLAKLRGIDRFMMREVLPHQPVGVLDAGHSKNCWATAYLAQQYNNPCYCFYPEYVKEKLPDGSVELRESQVRSLALGAKLRPLPARLGYSAVLFTKAKEIMAKETDGCGIMIPNAMKYQHSIDAVTDEVMHTPKDIIKGTYIIPIGTGTMAAGIMLGLQRLGFRGKVVVVCGYTQNEERLRKYLRSALSEEPVFDLMIHDGGWKYHDIYQDAYVPDFCDPYYEAKAWRHMRGQMQTFRQPIVFWNMGD